MLEKPITWMLIFFTTLAAFTARTIINNQDQLFEHSKDLPEILHLIDLAYVDEVDMENLMPHAYQGALEALDPNASFVPAGQDPTLYGDAVFQKTGVVLARRDGYGYVLSCAVGSPAARAGLERGVYIQKINNRKTRKMSHHGMEQLLATVTGTITLELVVNDEEKNKNIQFQPGPFETPKAMHHNYLDGVHHIRLKHCYPGFGNDLSGFLADIPANDTRILLDLRDNARGSEKDLLELSSLFLKKGLVGSWQSGDKVIKPVTNPEEGAHAHRRLYILVNNGTARAAECFAAAAEGQGHTLVGKASIGLGFHYKALPLSSGAHVIIPTHHFVLQSGESLTGAGLSPKLEVGDYDPDEGEDPMLQKALELIRKAPLEKAG